MLNAYMYHFLFQNANKKRDSVRANLETSETSPANKLPRLSGDGPSS